MFNFWPRTWVLKFRPTKDSLQLDIPSVIGVVDEEEEDVKMEVGEASHVGRNRKTFIGTTNVIVPRPNCDMKNFMNDGMSQS